MKETEISSEPLETARKKLKKLKQKRFSKQKRLDEALKLKEEGSQQESNLEEQKEKQLLQVQQAEKSKKEKLEELCALKEKNELLSKKIADARSEHQRQLNALKTLKAERSLLDEEYLQIEKKYEAEQKKCILPPSEKNLSKQIEKNNELERKKNEAAIKFSEEVSGLESLRQACDGASAIEEKLKEDIAALKAKFYREKQENEQSLAKYQAFLISAGKQKLDFLTKQANPDQIAQIKQYEAYIRETQRELGRLSIFTQSAAAADVQPPEGYTPGNIIFQ